MQVVISAVIHVVVVAVVTIDQVSAATRTTAASLGGAIVTHPLPHRVRIANREVGISGEVPIIREGWAVNTVVVTWDLGLKAASMVLHPLIVDTPSAGIRMTRSISHRLKRNQWMWDVHLVTNTLPTTTETTLL